MCAGRKGGEKSDHGRVMRELHERVLLGEILEGEVTASGSRAENDVAWTYCSRVAPGPGLPLQLPGSERRAGGIAGAQGYMYVASRQRSGTHSRLRTGPRSSHGTNDYEGRGGVAYVE